MHFLDTIWDFPNHHVSLGWWLAAALSLWNVITPVFTRIIGKISFLGRNFRSFRNKQLAMRIHNLDYLHENTNGLIRYLATDTVDIAIESSWLCIAFVVLLFTVYPVSIGKMFAIMAFNVGTTIIGRALRIRTVLNDLRNYPKSVELLRVKFDRLYGATQPGIVIAPGGSDSSVPSVEQELEDSKDMRRS
jgi:hypothetical protein